MTGVRLDLKDSTEQHLAATLSELHRLVDGLLTPSASTDEEWAIDMAPKEASAEFHSLDRLVHDRPKLVTFDGAEYFSIPKEILRAKRLKVLLTAVVYGKRVGKQRGGVSFRLVRGDGMPIPASYFMVTSEEPVTITRYLPFGDQEGCVAPSRHDYIIEGRYLDVRTLPVCRRLSLSFVYI